MALDYYPAIIKFVNMPKTNLMGYTERDLENLVSALGEKKFKGRQLAKWVYNLQVRDFARMTNLSLNLRQRLAADYAVEGLRLKDKAVSRDGTIKYLFELEDKRRIETVMIPEGEKRTVCISSQSGCPLKCTFCATAIIKRPRNLTVGEIIGQLMHIRGEFGLDGIQNIVFMGMGEPLLNLENVQAAVEIISSEIGLSLTARHITVSTAGVVPGIMRLADSGLKVNLAISLNSAVEEKRRRLMPIARKYSLAQLKEAARYFAVRRKRRVTFEYILFAGINDSREDARALAEYVRGIPCKINLLAYNEVASLPYRRPGEAVVNEFAEYLYPRTPAVTVRKSRGRDIAAACGQLAGKDSESGHGEGEDKDA